MARRIFALVALVVALALPRAAAADDATRSQSPYFFVEGAAPGVEALPLESTRADVHVSGVIADVTVTQTYRNDGDLTISARYVFPASTRAAVYGLTMKVGARVIEARIEERDEARKIYDAAKSEGKTASLLEEDRPNVFTMNVANILPGDHIEVVLRYTELLVPTDGVYELVYPTVVGPRYAGSKLDPTAAIPRFVASPYTHAGTDPTYAFDIGVTIAAGMPIASVDSPSHAIATAFAAGNTAATVALDHGAATGNKDFVLRYRLAGDAITPGLLLYPGKTENFFLLMLQPPKRPPIELVPPREYVFILDVSGSMAGFPLDTAKALMRDLLGRLRPTDRFDVLLFAGDSRLYHDTSVAADAASIAGATAFVDGTDGGGGTELLPALQRAMAIPRAGDGVSRTFVVVTDGYISEEAAMFDQVRTHLDDANVFAFGIGSAVNRHLIEGIAKAGQGEPFVVLRDKDAADAAARFRAYVESPVLTHVKVGFAGFDAYDVEPPSIPDVFADRPVVVFGKYRGAAAGTVSLTGVSGRGRYATTVDVSKVAPDPANAALSYLWARAKVSELSDFAEGDAHKADVTALGLAYNLLTKYTSFVAVEEVVRPVGDSADVDQPLPMPAGVSDLAVGDAGDEVGAEPELLVLVALAGLAGLLWLRRTRARASV